MSIPGMPLIDTDKLYPSIPSEEPANKLYPSAPPEEPEIETSSKEEEEDSLPNTREYTMRGGLTVLDNTPPDTTKMIYHSVISTLVGYKTLGVNGPFVYSVKINDHLVSDPVIPDGAALFGNLRIITITNYKDDLIRLACSIDNCNFMGRMGRKLGLVKREDLTTKIYYVDTRKEYTAEPLGIKMKAYPLYVYIPQTPTKDEISAKINELFKKYPNFTPWWKVFNRHGIALVGVEREDNIQSSTRYSQTPSSKFVNTFFWARPSEDGFERVEANFPSNFAKTLARVTVAANKELIIKFIKIHSGTGTRKNGAFHFPVCFFLNNEKATEIGEEEFKEILKNPNKSEISE
ncbi:MAG: hypothetical protein K940chlam6_00394 [Chlamydiae bacterium]|nr:hypothetical protein [Chlamydiota bacterium]